MKSRQWERFDDKHSMYLYHNCFPQKTGATVIWTIIDYIMSRAYTLLFSIYGTTKKPVWRVSDLYAVSETLYHRDDALLYIPYVMLIWAAPIPADRWHCSLWP